MKKIVVGMIMMIIVAMFVTSFVVTGFAQQEEEVNTDALIEELIYEDFQQSKENENIWTYEEDLEFDDDTEYATAYARYDTERNIGILTIVDSWIDDGIERHYWTYIVRWDFEIEDFEVIGEFKQ